MIYLSLDENLHNYFRLAPPFLSPPELMIDYCNPSRSVQGLACPMLIHEFNLSRLGFINLFLSITRLYTVGIEDILQPSIDGIAGTPLALLSADLWQPQPPQ